MEENDIFSLIADTYTGKQKDEITIPIIWHEPLSKYKILNWILLKIRRKPLEKERKFVINPCVVANMIRIAGRSARLPVEIGSGDLEEVVLPLIHQHMEDVIYVVAAGIQNNHLEPDEKLITFIKRNFDSQDLCTALQPILNSVGMQSFLNTIVLMKGSVMILKNRQTSPQDGSE